MSQLADPLSGQFDRLPPSAIDAERCLLASMMLDKDMIGQVVQIVDRVLLSCDSESVPNDMNYPVRLLVLEYLLQRSLEVSSRVSFFNSSIHRIF